MRPGHRRRFEELRRRKNFLPSITLTIIFWALLLITILFIDPQTRLILPLFFALLFLALTFTTSIILINSRQGILIGLAITIFVFLRYLGVGNILNFLLLIGVATLFEMYFRKKS